ncbi:hypothetical protein D9615_001716 [Tricholomella constricta]|uniref:Uncharacterized protein n=1 Tax=Tricholomella constricta TaxID=117010 RepID=A0A8H5MAK3_9AGAR|nr:hypothetical protein D9615_001716 [Tricholomella constricta]
MPVPELSKLENTAKDLVRTAKRDGTISKLTVRIVREKVEQIYGLEPGILEAKEYKRPLKAIIKHESNQGPAENVEESPSKSELAESDVQGAGDDEKSGESSKKATKAPKRRPETGKVYKSAEMIECSDLEDLSEIDAKVLKKSSPRKDVRKRKQDRKSNPPPPKRIKVVQSDDESDDETPAKPEAKAKERDVERSDSEISSLFGDSPHPKMKAPTLKEKAPMKKPANKKAISKAKSTSESSKDEATIKRLKSFVNACGVRKPWARVFQDLPKPSQQIVKLKEILSELGMSGRMSMEQAKRIREKRELAQELEDVKSFEQSVLVRASRSQTRSASRPTKPGKSENEESEEEGEEGEEVKPRKRKGNALRSINAFLDDQSDDN